MKKCIRCKENKDISNFNKDKSRIDGYNTRCKPCSKLYRDERKDITKEYWKNYYGLNKEEHDNRVNKWFNKNPYYNNEYYINNKEKIHLYNKQKYLSDPESVKRRNNIWNQNNIDRVKLNKRNYENNRVKVDPLYKMVKTIRYAVWRSFKDGKYFKSKRTEEILGCTFQELYNHIESLFQPWMTWNNKGYPKDGIFEPNKTWDIDYIIPISSAKSEEDILRLNHYTNFQPLCSYINRNIKRDRLDF